MCTLMSTNSRLEAKPGSVVRSHITQSLGQPRQNTLKDPAVIGEDRLFPPQLGAKGDRQRVEKSFKTLLELAGIWEFRFHDLRHTFASWYMMNGGDLYELAKILGHSNIRMTERYAKLGKTHIAKTGDTAKAMWSLMAGKHGERAASAV